MDFEVYEEVIMGINKVGNPDKDFIIPGNMTEHTVLTKGVWYNKRKEQQKEAETIPNGAIAQLFDNQFMIVTDGGKIVDWTDEPGYYEIVKSSASKGFFSRFKNSTLRQQVYYINTKEITGIKFGTQTPIGYYDKFYDAEMFIRAHGTYSIRITDPVRFYEEVVAKDQDEVSIEEVNAQYLMEFLTALQVTINKMSEQGERISYLPSKATELGQILAGTLDHDWRQLRGFEIESVAIASISYDEMSKRLIEKKNMEK